MNPEKESAPTRRRAHDAGPRHLMTDEATRRVLEDRARRLAQPAAELHADAGGNVLVFRVGSDLYAVPLDAVIEALPQQRIAAVPGAAAEVAGLVQIRGEVVPVYELAILRGGTAKAARADSQEAGVIILVQREGRRAGLLASDVEGISTQAGLERTVTVLDIHSLIGEEP